MAEFERVEIGFFGQVLAVKITSKELAKLRDALKGGGGWFELETDDGQISLDLNKATYMRIASGERGVGFSSK